MYVTGEKLLGDLVANCVVHYKELVAEKEALIEDESEIETCLKEAQKSIIKLFEDGEKKGSTTTIQKFEKILNDQINEIKKDLEVSIQRGIDIKSE